MAERGNYGHRLRVSIAIHHDGVGGGPQKVRFHPEMAEIPKIAKKARGAVERPGRQVDVIPGDGAAEGALHDSYLGESNFSEQR